MLKVCALIPLFTYLVCVTWGMDLFDGLTTHFDILLQKGVRYKHDHHDYEESLSSGSIPSGLCLKNLSQSQKISIQNRIMFYMMQKKVL